MPNASPNSSRIRFGVYELDPTSLELRKSGSPVRLQPQPCRVLALLAGNPGKLVTREEIRQHLWGNNTFVDVRKGVGFCLKQLRAVLGDNPRVPHFIETLPRRGYRFIFPVEGVNAQERRWFQQPKAVDEVVVAVLPFGNLSGDDSQEYFADGMTEALIVELARISAIRVISRTSIMQYKGSKKPLPEMARDLNADVIVEGVVLRSGQRVRVAAQLIDGSTDRHLWAESYERKITDVLSLQAEVAHAIASAVKGKLTPEEEERLTADRPVNPEAYESYLKGRFYWNKRTGTALNKSIDYFEETIRKGGYSAQAYAGLADAYLVLGFYDTEMIRPKTAFAKARESAQKALELDDSLADAHTSLAQSKMCLDWDRPGADLEFRRAIALNANYATAHHWHALCLSANRRFPEALEEIRAAKTLDPLSASINTSVALCSYLSRQYDVAAEYCRKTLQTSRHYVMAHTVMGMAYEQKGDLGGAINEFKKAVCLWQRNTFNVGCLGHAYATAGRRQDAQRVLSELEARSKHEYISPYARALIYVGLEESGKAVEFLMRAFEDRSGWLMYLDVDPRFDRVRENPGYIRFRGRIGAQAWD